MIAQKRRTKEKSVAASSRGSSEKRIKETNGSRRRRWHIFSERRYRDGAPAMAPGNLHGERYLRTLELCKKQLISEDVRVQGPRRGDFFSVRGESFRENNSPLCRSSSIAELAQRLKRVHLAEVL